MDANKATSSGRSGIDIFYHTTALFGKQFFG